MADTPYADFLKLAGIRGPEGMRHVRTPEGAAFFNLPIGTPITEAQYQAIKKAHLAKGATWPKGMTTKNPANVENGKVAGAVETAIPNKTAGAPSAGPVGKTAAPASPFPDSKGAPNPPAAETVKPVPVKKPTISGPNKFTVGTTGYSAPNGSRIYTPTDGSQMAYVITPDGDVHAFNAQGEVPIDSPVLKKALETKFNENFQGDNLFSVGQFDAAAPNDLASLPKGSDLEDINGQAQFHKTGDNEWQHTGLGIKLGDADVQPFVDSGELSVSQHKEGTDSEGNLDFSSMDMPTFTESLNKMKKGSTLYYKGEEITKTGNTSWSMNDGTDTPQRTTTKALWWLKPNLSDNKDLSNNPTPSAADVPENPGAEVPKADVNVPGVNEPNAPSEPNAPTKPETPAATNEPTAPEVPVATASEKPALIKKIGGGEENVPAHESLPKDLPERMAAAKAAEGQKASSADKVSEPVKPSEPAEKKPEGFKTKNGEFDHVAGKPATADDVAAMKPGDQIISKMGSVHTKNEDGSFQYAKHGKEGSSKAAADEVDLKNSAGFGNQFHYEPKNAELKTPEKPEESGKPKVGDKVSDHKDFMKNAAPGTVIHHGSSPSSLNTHEKNAQGDWINEETGLNAGISDKHIFVTSGNATIKKLGTEPKVDEKEAAKQKKIADDAEALKAQNKADLDALKAKLKGPSVGDSTTDHLDYIKGAPNGTVISNGDDPKPMTSYVKKDDGWYNVESDTRNDYFDDPKTYNFVNGGPAVFSKLGGQSSTRADEVDKNKAAIDALKEKLQQGSGAATSEDILNADPGDTLSYEGLSGEKVQWTKSSDQNLWTRPNGGKISSATLISANNAYLKTNEGSKGKYTLEKAPAEPEVKAPSTEDKMAATVKKQLDNANPGDVATVKDDAGKSQKYTKNHVGQWVNEHGHKTSSDFLSKSGSASPNTISLQKYNKVTSSGVTPAEPAVKPLKAGTEINDLDTFHGLQPGTKLHWKFATGTQRDFTKNPDGTWTDDTDESHTPRKDTYFDNVLVSPNVHATVTKDGSLPEDEKTPEVPEPYVPKKVGDSVDAAWINDAKPGASFINTPKNGDTPVNWSKQESGIWGNDLNNNVTFPDSVLQGLVGNEGVDVKITSLGDENVAGPKTIDEPDVSLPKEGEVIPDKETLNKLPTGTKVHYLKKDGSTSVYVKLENGAFLTPGGGQFQPEGFNNWAIKNGKFSVGSYPVLNKAEDLNAPTSDKSTTFVPGGHSYSIDDMEEALNSLHAHPGFQVSYGLKAVPDNSIAKHLDELKQASAAAYPDLKPKPAAVKYLQDKLGIQSVPDPAAPEDLSPKITVKAGDATHEFTQAEVNKAIDILKNYNGKLYTNELTKQGSPLGKVKWNDAVGFHKDKEEGKQAVIDLLTSKVSNYVAAVDQDTPVKFSEMNDMPIGQKLFYDNGGTGDKNSYEVEKVGPDLWDAAGYGAINEGSFQGAADAGYLTKISAPADTPSYVQAPAAVAAKAPETPDEPDVNSPGTKNLLPGKYEPETGKGSMHVNGDGSAVWTKSDGSTQAVDAVTAQKLHDKGMNQYKGVEDKAPLKPVAKAVKKAKTAEKLADGTYFGGSPANAKSWVYEAKGDDVNVFKPKTSTPNSTKKLGGKTDSEWLTNATPGAQFEYKSYGASQSFTKNEGGDWINDATGEKVNDNILASAGYYWNNQYKIKSHGTGEPTKITKAKLQGLFEQGKLTDSDGNSILPNGHTGTVTLFGGETTIPALLEFQKKLDSYGADTLASTINSDMKNLGINVDNSLAKKYTVDHFGEGTNPNLVQAFKGVIGNLLDGVDTTIPESDASKLFSYDELGYPTYPTLPSSNSYNTSEMKAFIKAAAASFGDGKIIGQHEVKMDKSQKNDWIAAFKTGNFAEMYHIESVAAAKDLKAHASGYLHPGYEGNEATNHIKWGAAVPGEIPANEKIPGEWSSDIKLASEQELNNYMILAHMQNPTYLSTDEKRSWVKYHQMSNKANTDHFSVTALERHKAGTAPLSDPLEWTAPEDLPIVHSYDHLFDSTPNPTGGWTGSGYDVNSMTGSAPEYIKDNPDNKELQDLFQEKIGASYYPGNGAVKAVQEYFQKKADEEAAKALIPVYTALPTKNLKKSTHPTFPYEDQFGNKYWFKPAYENKLGKYRTEAEHFGNKIGNFFGFKSADSQLVTIDGKYGQLQKDVGGVDDLTNMDYSGFDAKKIADIGNEHILDWILDNDDTHGDNAKVMADGHIVGIDKGRAFKHYGAWKGLSADSKMDSNAATIYNKLYTAIRSGKLNKEEVDKAYLAIQKRATLMQKRSDDDLMAMVDEAMANRDDYDNAYTIDGKKVPNSLAGLKAAILDRKSTLSTDFEKMWAKIYKDGNLGDLPEPPQYALGEGIHSGLDDTEMHDKLFSVNSHGKSTALGSNDFVGKNVTFWNDHNSDGTQNMNMEAFLSPEKQKELLKYFQSKAVDAAPTQSEPSGLAAHDIYGSAMVDAAKTISHHAQDGNYNMDKISLFKSTQDLLQKDLDAWTPNMAPTSDDGLYHTFPSGQKVPMNQVDQYKIMLDHYANVAPDVFKAYEEKTKSPKVEVFSPVALGNPPAVYINSKTGEKMTKLADGSWIINNGHDLHVQPKELSENTEKDLQKLPDWKPLEAAPVEKNNGVKIVYGVTHDQEGSMVDGKLVYLNKHISQGAPGSEYSVILPTGEQIYFRNSTSTGTIKSQIGKLSVRIKGLKGGSDSQAAMQRVMSQLDTLGLDTTPADHVSAENTYWHEMAQVLTERHHEEGSKYEKAFADLSKKATELTVSPNDNAAFLSKLSKNMGQEDENQWWRDLWSTHFGSDKVNKLIDEEKYLPYFEHADIQNPEEGVGKPQWDRFDLDLADYIKGDKYIVSSLKNGEDDIPKILNSGAALSTEERLRFYGNWIKGISSDGDQALNSSHVIYSRIKTPGEIQDGGYHVLYNPRVMLRTRTYSYDTDHWGNPTYKAGQAPSNPTSAYNDFYSSVNETLPPDLTSILDSMELFAFSSASLRNDSIQALKAKGITEIRGLPVEERLIMKKNWAEAIKKVTALWQS